MNFKPKFESEFILRLRATALAQPQKTRCGICNVGVKRSAASGIRWFERHEQTPRHRRMKARSGRRR